MAADKKAEAAAAKARGNAAFAKGDFETGAREFSAAIDADPTDHVFWSNRSACYASLNRHAEALADANKCVEIKPDWAKGYSRQGTALHGLRRLEEAKAAYEKGLTYDAANAQLQESLAQVKAAIAEAANPPNPMGKLFGDSMWGKLQANPTTRAYLNDPAFVQKLRMLQSNPSALGSLSSDPKMSTAIGVILGIDLGGGAGAGPFGGAPGGFPGAAGAGAGGAPGAAPMADDVPADDDDADMGKEEEIHAIPKAQRDAAAAAAAAGGAQNQQPPQAAAAAGASSSSSSSNSASSSSSSAKPAAAKAADVKDQKAPLNKEAEDEKKKGNDCYNAKKLDDAIKHYEKAQQLDPKNATYVLNTTAAVLELKQYAKCIELCEKGIALAQENQQGFEIQSKFWLRIGNARLAEKNYDEACKAYNKSLLEHFSDKAKQQLKKAQDLKKAADALAYLDKGKSLEAKERGNKLFTAGKFIDAIPEYTEAIKRDPSSAALYSNRAGCYAKVMDWARALDDCEKALSIDPKFVKVYIRKGKIQHMLKQYKKALETYDAGLKLDPNASELVEGRMNTLQAIRSSAASGQADPERLKEAMRDPEIRGILNDMTMQKVLKDMQENPQAAQAAMKDKDIRANIEKLIAAGVLSVG